jgi:hypothetical protein
MEEAFRLAVEEGLHPPEKRLNPPRNQGPLPIVFGQAEGGLPLAECTGV